MFTREDQCIHDKHVWVHRPHSEAKEGGEMWRRRDRGAADEEMASEMSKRTRRQEKEG